MTVLAVALGIVLIAFVLRESQHADHIAEREKTWDLERGSLLAQQASSEEAWRQERSELLTRIQHPTVYVPRRVEMSDEEREKLALAKKEFAEDEIDLIGTVVDGIEEPVNG